MLDYMTFRVSNLERSRAFYTAALATLGYTESTAFEFDGQKMVGLGFKADGVTKMDTWLVQGPSPHGGPAITTGCHLCWRAANRAEVDAFYVAAMAAGGKDNGPPGLREHYHPNYYGAFVIDPDGNNVEAVCHLPIVKQG
jgi:catechol 2,3-dioxygenase-like lactoylglutathione lyase family enzyme